MLFLHDMNPQDRSEALFTVLDKDNNGYLDRAELSQAFGNAIRTASKLYQHRSSLSWLTSIPSYLSPSLALQNAGASAADKKETSTAAESKIQERSRKAVEKILAKADVNKDGRISREEWIQHAQDLPVLSSLLIMK